MNQDLINKYIEFIDNKESNLTKIKEEKKKNYLKQEKVKDYRKQGEYGEKKFIKP